MPPGVPTLSWGGFFDGFANEMMVTFTCEQAHTALEAELVKLQRRHSK